MRPGFGTLPLVAGKGALNPFPALFKGNDMTMKLMTVGDSLNSIFEGLTKMMTIVKDNNTMIIDFSQLRKRGDIVDVTQGIASGPVSFMKIYEDALVRTRMRAKVYVYLSPRHHDYKEFKEHNFRYLRKINQDQFKKVLNLTKFHEIINNKKGE